MKKSNKITKSSPKTFIGQVISDKMQHTLTVLLSYKRIHPLYRKIVKKNKKILVDDNLSAKIGDMVKVAECKPLSKRKKFTTLKIIK